MRSGVFWKGIMIKVFLVEDEIVMREGIKKNIPWESEGFEFVGDASDGELAYPLIQKSKPDILITDIKMPFMDGIELSRLVKKDMPDIKIIFLTGYDEFAYAKEAISIGVAEYLLKPITSAQLIEVLHKVEASILEERKKSLPSDSSEEWEKTRAKRLGFFRKLTGGELSISQIYEEGEKFGIEFVAPSYNIVLLQFFFDTDVENEADIRKKVEETIQEISREFPQTFVVEKNKEEYAALIKETDDSSIDETIELCEKKLRDELQGEKLEYYAVIGNPVERIGDIKNCFKKANEYFAHRYLRERNQTMHCQKEELGESEASVDFMTMNLSQADSGRLSKFIETGLKSGVEQFVDNYFEKIGTKNMQSTLFRQYVIMDMSIIIMGTLQEMGYSKEELVADFGKTENLSQIYNGTEPTKKYIISCIKRAMEYRDEAVSDKKDDLIKKACTYIGENYSNEDISLNMVAKYVGVSPNHFSTMFAQNMNKTFVEYLTDVRMEQAKILLRTTNMRTSDIAFEVGYHDSHYFSSLFKKNQNMTPREYRAAN